MPVRPPAAAPSRRPGRPFNGATRAGRVLCALILTGLLGALAPGAAAAADPAAGYDVTWSVTRPNLSTRSDDAIAVGDDVSVSYAAVDGTPVTECRIRFTASGGGLMESPGTIADGACSLRVRLPDFPDSAGRAHEPDSVNLDLCVWTASIAFSDGQTRTMAAADQTRPAGRLCNNFVDGTDRNVLDFRVDATGTRRAFDSSPVILSWDPRDWGTDMQPMRFGEPWRVEVPAGIDRCRIWLNGSSSSLTPAAPDGCQPWDVRIPGVLPAALPWTTDEGSTWGFQTLIDYTVSEPGPGSWTISDAQTPMASSDGVFESSLPAIFPTDLAHAQFSTAGERWQPAFQVSGGTASNCQLTFITVPPTWPQDDLIFEYFDVAPDGDGVCTFDLDPLGEWESHQYWVHPTLTVNDDPNLQYGADILGIPVPQPPVIDTPIPEPDGDTGMDVEPGDGQGLVVDLEVAPEAALAAAGASPANETAAATPVCSDRVVSTNLDAGGSIPTLEASCGLAPGRYRATARMVDAAGTVTTSQRVFTVLAPRPVVTGRSPGPGATGIARDVKPTVIFDVPVTGVSASSFRLRDTVSGAYLTATVGYNGSTRRATMTPATTLVAGRTYRLYLTSAIKSTSSARQLAAIDWTFRVSTDITKPTIIGRSPAADATGVKRTSNIAVRFSEAVRGVTTSTFQLRDTVTGLYLPATVTYNATTHLATLNPTPILVANRRYAVIVRSGIRDMPGNAITTSTRGFTTGS